MTFCCSSESLGFRLSFSASSSLRFRIISRFLWTSSSVRMTAGPGGKGSVTNRRWENEKEAAQDPCGQQHPCHVADPSAEPAPPRPAPCPRLPGHGSLLRVRRRFQPARVLLGEERGQRGRACSSATLLFALGSRLEEILLLQEAGQRVQPAPAPLWAADNRGSPMRRHRAASTGPPRCGRQSGCPAALLQYLL